MKYRYGITGWAAFTLLVLRLAVGWHFFQEGLSHYSDPAWSVDGFLRQTKGPLAEMTRAISPDGDFHGWNQLLLVPREQLPGKAEATKPYDKWQEQTKTDWKEYLGQLSGRMTEEQKSRGVAIRDQRFNDLDDLLADYEDDIRTYQHQLYRSQQMRAAPGADVIPNQKARLAGRQSDPTLERGIRVTGEFSGPSAWQAALKGLEDEYKADIWNLLDDTQQKNGVNVEYRQPWAVYAYKVMQNFGKYGVLIVGACLLVGLFTRLASWAGVLFLLSIVAMQPPWLPESVPTYSHVVEAAAMLVLAATAAGRFAGLDYFTYRLFGGR